MSLRPYLHLDVSLAGQPAGARVALAREPAHHLRTVLRARPGARLEVADGCGWQADAVLEHGDHLRLEEASVEHPVSAPRLILVQALGKGRRFDEVVRVTTELGVDAIVPVHSAHGVVRLEPDRAERALQRWEGVARAACEQARRPRRPQLASPGALAPHPPQVLSASAQRVVLVAVPGAATIARVLPRARTAAEVVVVIGPEGGLSDAELAVLVDRGAIAVGLGPHVLRTEHAGAAALAVLAAGSGRWGPSDHAS